MEQMELARKLYTALKITENKLEDLARKEKEPVAIVGMACRFPGADDIKAFWQQLCNGFDGVTEVPADRWNADLFYDERPEAPGKTYCRYGAFIRDVKGFDAAFFGITPAEARQMDPQQRILLQEVWHALEHANIRPAALAGSNTAVFMGVSENTYQLLSTGDMGAGINNHFVTGNALSTAAGRISYYYNFQGANMVVNTACSSSLVAVDLGMRELKSGNSDVVIAGGINLMLLPYGHISLSGTRALAADGRCKSFDELADGYGRGEGCGIVVLKRYADAVKDGDTIYALIRGSAVNQDGASNGMTAPNGAAQEKLIRKALDAASVKPTDVAYVEAHGTGTRLGDPIELETLQKIFTPGRLAETPLYLGSVKTNIGHSESAAGVASLIKTALLLREGVIPANLHFCKPTPAITWDNSIQVPVRTVKPEQRPKFAGISSFGFSGTNAHMLLEAAAITTVTPEPDLPSVLLLSAKSPESLQRLAEAYASILKNSTVALQDICYTAAMCREHFAHRLAIAAQNREEAVVAIRQFLETGKTIPVQQSPNAYNLLAEAYLSGADPLQSGDPLTGKKVNLPQYPFGDTAYWTDSAFYRQLCGEIQTVPSAPEKNVETRNAEDIRTYVMRIIREITELPDDILKPDEDIFAMGMDSIMVMQLKEVILTDLGANLEVSLFYNTINTIHKIISHLEQQVGGQVALPETEVQEIKNITVKSTTGADVFVPYKGIDVGKEAQHDHRGEALLRLAREVNVKTQASKDHTQKYRRWLANNRNIAGFKPRWKEMVYQPVAARADGPWIWDEAGNRFLDFTMGFGVHLFGYNPAFVADALHKAIKDQMMLGALSPLAGELAQQICEVTGNERAAFYNTGTEAVMVSLRLARATTGRDKIVMFAGAYHGTFDGILARQHDGVQGEPLAPGIPQSMVLDVLVLNYGDEQQLEVIEQMAPRIAAVLVETVQSRRPDFFPEAYLQKLGELTTRHGIALIFDEVISGFRFAINGIRNFTDVVPDMSVYGKVIGGGVPIGVVAGKARFLDAVDGGYWQYGDDSFPQARNTFVAGTFCHHPMAMAAGIAVISHLRAHPGIYKDLDEKTAFICNELNQWFNANRVPVKMVHFGSLFRFVLKGNTELLFFKLLSKGIYIWEGRNCYISTAHSQEQIECLVASVKESCMELVAEGWIKETEAEAATRQNEQTYRLSYPQLNIWWANQLNQSSSDFNLAESFIIEAGFDPEKFEQSLQLLSNRHDILRTSFHEKDGTPYQVVHVEVACRLHRITLSGMGDVQQVARRFNHTGFDLSKPCLLQAVAGELPGGQYFLSLIIHHIICDGWAFEILFDELIEIYTALMEGKSPALKPARLQYHDFIAQEESTKADAALRQFWAQQVAGLKPVVLPRETVSGAAARDGFLQLTISGEMFRLIKTSAASWNTTVFVVLLSVTKLLLYRATGAVDIAVGSPIPARNRPGWNRLMGLCLNLLVIRSKIDPADTFGAFVRTMHQVVLDAYERQEYPFELLKDEHWTDRRPGALPFFEIEVSMQNFRMRRKNNQRGLGELQMRNLTELSFDSRKYPVEFRFDEGGDDIILTLAYDPALFPLSQINKLVKDWSETLKTALENPLLTIGELETLISTQKVQEEKDALNSLRKNNLSKLLSAR